MEVFAKASGFPPSGLSAAVGSLSFYVKKGIACWSNSGFHTPLTTSINAGGLIITDSKIFQSPLKTSTRKVFFVLAFVSALIEKQNTGETCLTQTWNEFIAATALVYVKFGVQSSLQINTCVCLSDFLVWLSPGGEKSIRSNLKAQQNDWFRTGVWSLSYSFGSEKSIYQMLTVPAVFSYLMPIAVDAYPFYLSKTCSSLLT